MVSIELQLLILNVIKPAHFSNNSCYEVHLLQFKMGKIFKGKQKSADHCTNI